jgi:hypothetical protein
MRQTLWAEQMIKYSSDETVKSTNYLHVHVIPEENSDLLHKRYKCSGKDMETTWREHLKDQSKYLIISPSTLLSGLNQNIYKEFIDYIKIRY